MTSRRDAPDIDNIFDLDQLPQPQQIPPRNAPPTIRISPTVSYHSYYKNANNQLCSTAHPTGMYTVENAGYSRSIRSQTIYYPMAGGRRVHISQQNAVRKLTATQPDKRTTSTALGPTQLSRPANGIAAINPSLNQSPQPQQISNRNPPPYYHTIRITPTPISFVPPKCHTGAQSKTPAAHGAPVLRPPQLSRPANGIAAINPSFNVNTKTEMKVKEYTVLDENARQKIRRIHPRCYYIGAYYNAKTCDVNFIFNSEGNEEVVPAHKSILAFNSPVFRQMFNGELKEKGDIKLTDATVDAFIDFLECIYNKLTVDGSSESQMSGMLHLAHKYDVNWLEQELKKGLFDTINNNIDSVLWVLPLVNLYDYRELQHKCISMIQSNGVSLIQLAEFVDCEREVLKQMLSINFKFRHEISVFKMCIKWAKRACEKSKFELDPESPENIRQQLGDFFNLIRFESMNMAAFMRCLSINSAVFTFEEIQKYARKINGIEPPQKLRKKECVDMSKKFEICSPFLKEASPSLQLFLEDKETADTTFVLKNNQNGEINRIRAHKCVLAQCSEAFEDHFQNTINSSADCIADSIAGVSVEVFKEFLQLLYTYFYGQFESIAKKMADQHIGPILSIAETYKVIHINEWYKIHLHQTMNEQNVIWRFELACKHSLDELKTKCIDLMEKRGERIITSEAFLDCSQENLKAILKLGIWDDKKSLVGACIKWAKKYCKENELDAAVSYDLRTALGDAFGLIPFSTMDPVEFVNFQCDYGDLFTVEEIKQIAKQVASGSNVKQT